MTTYVVSLHKKASPPSPIRTRSYTLYACVGECIDGKVTRGLIIDEYPRNNPSSLKWEAVDRNFPTFPQFNTLEQGVEVTVKLLEGRRAASLLFALRNLPALP